MNAFLELDFADRQLGCKAVQAAMGLDAASVEKDFWVCWTLRELFALPGVGGHLTLAWLGGGSAREDKVFSPAERSAFLEKPVVIEEKVDGANIGISVSPSGEIRVQNRGQYIQLPSPGAACAMTSGMPFSIHASPGDSHRNDFLAGNLNSLFGRR